MTVASKYWIKLYHEILDDPKMGRLPDHLWRRIIELFLMAGDVDQEGKLPCVADMAWRLRVDEAELQDDLDAIEKIGVVTRENGYLIVTRFADRQAPVSDAERMRRYRERLQQDQYYGNDADTEDERECNADVTDDVTNRNVDTDTDTDTDKDIHVAYRDILARWSELFPSKPQPTERNKALRTKTATRTRDGEFVGRWDAALVRASKSTFCNDGTWFTLNWFLANDENWRKCADGNYDNKSADGGRIKVRV
jgi:hypothetical protein